MATANASKPGTKPGTVSKPESTPAARRTRTPATGTPAAVSKPQDGSPGRTDAHEKTGPQPSHVGDAVLSEVHAFAKRFIIAPSDAALDAIVLWAAHTHALPALTTTPRLALVSDGPGSGKTRVLNILKLLSARALEELDPTGPAIATTIELLMPTLLIDETDTIFGASGSSGAKRTLRGILNSGYKRGGVLRRKSGKELVESRVFCPVAFGGLGRLPDTLMDRSIVIRMRKPQPGQGSAEAYYPRIHEPMGNATGEALGNWVKTVMVDIANAWTELPEGITDRKHEVAEPIIAIGDAAGPEWSKRARVAMTELLLNTSEGVGASPVDQLISDIRAVWPDGGAILSPEDSREGIVRNLPTQSILIALFSLPDSRYAKMWDPVSASRELASLLGTRGINVRKVKVGDRPLQGYRRQDFNAAWQDAETLAALSAAAKEAAESKSGGKHGSNGRTVPQVPAVPDLPATGTEPDDDEE